MESIIGFAPKGYCDWRNQEIGNYNDYICSKSSPNYIGLFSGDIPQTSQLPINFPFVGYVTPDGKTYQCERCEHENIIREIVLKNHLEEYLNTNKEFFHQLPYGMYQEEYFAMKKLKWVKVSSFANNPTQPILFRYYILTPEQTKIIYPT